jgi:hypothetical protein
VSFVARHLPQRGLMLSPTSMSAIMSSNHDHLPQHDSFLRLLVERVYWFAIGPLFLVLMLLGLLNDEEGRRVGYNIAYLLGLAGLPLSRWLEWRSGRAETADGHPATIAQIRQYAIFSVIIGLAVLVAVNAYLIWSAS